MLAGFVFAGLILPHQYWGEDVFLDMVSNGIVEVLYQCQRQRSKRDVLWVMSFIERQISLAIERASY
ncbi:hypothetical protein VIAG107301_14320 [Vibrio agarivorans]